jgi:UPF0042 nucleotide-binding protein
VAQQPQPLDVTFITGMSGAGRSQVGNVLEDNGFFVIDNLPPALIVKVVELARDRDRHERYGFVVDVRSGAFLEDLGVALTELHALGARTRILFLDASDETLVRRYDASRRRHPLSDSDRVADGIVRERALLEELKARADLVLDTSELNVHELRDRVLELFRDETNSTPLSITVISFGFKHGLPLDVDTVFDVRFLPNPHWVDELRPLTGIDAKVRRYVMRQPETRTFLDSVEQLFAFLMPAYVREGKSYLSIGIGCTGGRHRSVVVATELAKRIDRLGYHARVLHRDIERD